MLPSSAARACSGVGFGILLEQRHGRHHEPRRAEAAHRAVVRRRTPAAPAAAPCRRCKALDGADLLALGLDRQHGARVGGAPVDDGGAGAAGAAVAHPLQAGVSRRSRIASSSVTRGSTVSWCLLPLIVSVIGTGPGPDRRRPGVCASAVPPHDSRRHAGGAHRLQERASADVDAALVRRAAGFVIFRSHEDPQSWEARTHHRTGQDRPAGKAIKHSEWPRLRARPVAD